MNPYKRMCVIPEEEYNRLKLCTTMHQKVDDIPEVLLTQAPIEDKQQQVIEELPKVQHTFKCQICGKEYSNKRDRRRHIHNKHPHPSVAPIDNIQHLNESGVVNSTSPPTEDIIKPIKIRKRKNTFKALDNISKWLTLND